MKDLRRALVDGALVILPLGAVILLVLGILRRLQDAADPLSGRFVHPALTAVALLVRAPWSTLGQRLASETVLDALRVPA